MLAHYHLDFYACPECTMYDFPPFPEFGSHLSLYDVMATIHLMKCYIGLKAVVSCMHELIDAFENVINGMNQ